MKLFSKFTNFISRIWSSVKYWWNYNTSTEIMLVTYNVQLNEIECVDWCSEPIGQFCGVFKPELFEKIKPYCRLGDFPNTRIYIWAGMEEKHLAYSEPIENYLKDIKLWKTGQCFHFKSGKRYGEPTKVNCPTCGK